MNENKFLLAIRARRRELNIPQALLAKALGIAPSGYSMKESGKVNFTLTEAAKVVQVLQMEYTLPNGGEAENMEEMKVLNFYRQSDGEKKKEMFKTLKLMAGFNRRGAK